MASSSRPLAASRRATSGSASMPVSTPGALARSAALSNSGTTSTRGRRTGAAAPPLRELGEDPATGKPMVIKDGRFGPYVTDGETNASLRKGDEVAAITVAAGGRAARRPPRGPAVDPPEDHRYQEEGSHSGPFGIKKIVNFRPTMTIGD